MLGRPYMAHLRTFANAWRIRRAVLLAPERQVVLCTRLHSSLVGSGAAARLSRPSQRRLRARTGKVAPFWPALSFGTVNEGSETLECRVISSYQIQP